MEVELTPGTDACADCGGRLRRIGEDVTEELEYVPRRFIVNRIVRPRLTCSCCERFVQAPLPPRPIKRGRPGSGLLAHVLVSKFVDDLPLYRQIFDRDGLDLDRSTLADWVGKSKVLLEPLANAIHRLSRRCVHRRERRHVLSAEAIFADDTPVQMLAHGTGKTQTARLWTCARDERPWGSNAPPAALAIVLGPMADNSAISLFRRPEGTAPQGSPRPLLWLDECRRLCRLRGPPPLRCHPRGRLYDPRAAQVCRHPPITGVPDCRGTHRLDRATPCRRERGQSVASRSPRRASQAHASPVFDSLEAWLNDQLPNISGKSLLASAIRYAVTRMARMRPYLGHGILEIDHNTVKRAMQQSPWKGMDLSRFGAAPLIA
jgi:transposase